MTLKGNSQPSSPAPYPSSRQVCFKETHLSFSKDFKMSELRFCLKKKTKQKVFTKLSRTFWSSREQNHRVSEYPDSEGNHKDHSTLGPAQDNPNNPPMCLRENNSAVLHSRAAFSRLGTSHQHQLTWRPSRQAGAPEHFTFAPSMRNLHFAVPWKKFHHHTSMK